MAAGGVAHVGPAFQEDAATAVPPRCRISHYLVRRSAFMHNIEAAFKTNEILPHRPIFARQLRQRLSSLTRPAHQFFPRRRRVTDSALHFHPTDFEFISRTQHPPKPPDPFLHPLALRP